MKKIFQIYLYVRGNYLINNIYDTNKAIKILETNLKKQTQTRQVTVVDNKLLLVSSLSFSMSGRASDSVNHGTFKFINLKKDILISYKFRLKEFWVTVYLPMFFFCVLMLLSFSNKSEWIFWIASAIFLFLIFMPFISIVISSKIRYFLKKLYTQPSINKLIF